MRIMDDLLVHLPDYKYVLTTEQREQLALWDRQEFEPEESYNIFLRYFLPLGATRSLKRAWAAYFEAHRDVLFNTHNDINVVPIIWLRYYTTFEWLRRANAHDADKAQEAQLRWYERQETVRENEWELYLKLRGALEQGIDIYTEYLDEVRAGGAKKRSVVNSLDIERLSNAAMNYGRLPTGLPTTGQQQLVITPTAGENIEDVRKRRWQAMSERLHNAEGNVIEGEIVHDNTN